MYTHPSIHRSIVVIIVVLAFAVLALFPDGDLDALGGEALAERCAVTDARELLGREDREWLTVATGEDGGLGRLAAVEGRPGRSDVDEREAEAVSGVSSVDKEW
jgi:hypothetical protein